MKRSTRASAAFLACLAIIFGLLVAVSPTALASSPKTHPRLDPSSCDGASGVAGNIGSAVLGVVTPPILGELNLGTPYLDGDVVRADSSMSFYNWGSCMSQVAFQMQTRVCGTIFDYCHWVTRNHGTWEYLWKHADTGQVAQQVTMGCRQGTNSYRVHMAVIGPQSTAEKPEDPEKPGIIGVEPGENKDEDGPVVKLTC